jgi:hypothetical protein
MSIGLDQNKIEDVLNKAIISLNISGQIDLPTNVISDFIVFFIAQNRFRSFMHNKPILSYKIKMPTDEKTNEIIHNTISIIANRYNLNLIS